MSYLKDLIRRLGGGWHWIAAQFVLTLVLILAGLAWSRLPDKHVWQVALTLLVPLLLTICVLELEAGTMRAFSDDDGRRVKLVFGAVTLLAWVALFWACWAVLDWCDDRIPEWAGYLNSKATAGERATVFTYDHIQHWFTVAEWVLRWIIVPGKMIPYAMASAQWGWRIPFRRVIRLLLNWRWWPAVVLASLFGVVLPGHFFAGLPHGTVTHQIWAVGFKLVGSYVLAVGSWVLLLAWAAVLFDGQSALPKCDVITELFKRLRLSRRWVGAQFGWVLAWIWVNVAVTHLPGVQKWPEWLSVGLGASYRILIAIAALVVQAGMLRSMTTNDAKRIRPVWGTLALLLWGVLFGIAISMQEDYVPGQILQWLLPWAVTPAILFPFAEASALWGFRLPWRRVVRVVYEWRWWLGILAVGAVGKLAELYFDGARGWPYVWDVDLPTGLKMGTVDMLEIGIWILLLGWLAVVFELTAPPPGEVLVEDSALAGPPEPSPA